MLVEVKAMMSPRTMYHVLECAWGSCASANKPREEGLVIRCIHPAPTHRGYCVLVSKCVGICQPDQLWPPLPRRYQSIQKDASSGWSKEAMQDQQRSETRSPRHQCSFSLLPHMTRPGVFGWMWPFNPQYIFPSIHIDLEWKLMKIWHFYFWPVECLVHKTLRGITHI